MSLVSLVTAWERHLEDLLIAQIVANPNQFIVELDLPRKLQVTRSVAKAVLTGMRYVEIRRFNDIQQLGNRFLLPSKNPFRRITQSQQQALNDPAIIRNHIVHESTQSRTGYTKLLVRQGFRGKVPKPGFYLLARKGGKTRLEALIRDLRKGMRKLK